MIIYDIKCENGHAFEAWFSDSVSFEKQKEEGLVECPYCGNVRVERIPSAFAIGKARTKEEQQTQTPPQFTALVQLKNYIEKNFEDVGGKFAEEAIKIHYGETEQRNIRGTTTEEQEKELKEEGVPFIKIPNVRHDS